MFWEGNHYEKNTFNTFYNNRCLWNTLVFTDESIQLLKDVIDDEDIMLDFRLSGDRKVDGNLMFLDIDAVKEFYEDYVAAGGTKQDLSEVANSFPCEVKDID